MALLECGIVQLRYRYRNFPPGYAEWPAPAALRNSVACLWTRVITEDTERTALVLPDGCSDLIWEQGRGAFVAGPDTGPVTTSMAAGRVIVGVRFRPSAGGPALGVPLSELRDQRVDLADLRPADARRLSATLDPATAVSRALDVTATLVADARHSWLDALSSAGALAGLIAVALGQPWGDPVTGLAVTAFICHVGYQVTADVARRLADGIDPSVITGAEAAAGSVPGVIHAHARARWTGRTLRIEIEGWVDPDLPVRDADELGRQVATALAREVPDAGSLTWTTRAAPA